MSKIEILMIEDDFEIADLLSRYLKKFNITLNNFTSPAYALKELNNNYTDYNLVILDLSLPEMDGLDVCRIIKNSDKFSYLPVIIASARGEVSDRVTGLELGADDYIPKPYEPRELVARINAVIRRTTFKAQTDDNIKKVVIGDFAIDSASREILYKDEVLNLTFAEFEILKLLINNKNSVLSRDYISENVESIDRNTNDRTVDVIISRIRSKITSVSSDESSVKKHIVSVRGIGYKFVL